MRSYQDEVRRLEKKLAHLKAMKHPIAPKQHAYNVEQTEKALRNARLLADMEETAASKSFGDKTGLSDWLTGQKHVADKALRDSTMLKQTAAKATADMQRALAAQTAASASLRTAQEQANAYVDPLWKNPFVVGAGVLLGLAVVSSTVRG